jgi:hypothetical protein
LVEHATVFSAYNARQPQMGAAADQYSRAVRRARANAFREVRWWRRANNFESQAIRAA